ncbi:MAG: hypothetical protein Q9160_003732 [Pyrenula sp. 1 TL-2023]
MIMARGTTTRSLSLGGGCDNPRSPPEAVPDHVTSRYPEYQGTSPGGYSLEGQGQSIPARSTSLIGGQTGHEALSASLGSTETFPATQGYASAHPYPPTSASEPQYYEPTEHLEHQFTNLGLQQPTYSPHNALTALSPPPESLNQSLSPDALPDRPITIYCKGHKLKAEVDFSAERSIIKKTFLVKLLEDTRQTTAKPSTALGGRLTLPAGRRIYILRYNHEDLDTRLIEKVVHSPQELSCDILFGADWIRRHGSKFAQHDDQRHIKGRESGQDESTQSYALTPPYPDVSQSLLTYSSPTGVGTLSSVDEDVAVDFTWIKGTRGQKETLDSSVAKPGLSKAAIREHTIVYMRDTQPGRKANEIGMTKRPIAIEPANPREKLDPMSRLNFGKIYTVEYNVKVRNIGTVCSSSRMVFESYVQNALS